MTAEYDKFYVVNLYVPNSGQGLKAIEYRTNEWDPDLVKYVPLLLRMCCRELTRSPPPSPLPLAPPPSLRYLKKLEAGGKAVLVTGDLNVAHKDADVFNFSAPHIAKQAGCTEDERTNFDTLLGRGFVDTFRNQHADAKAAYSFWGARGAPKGQDLSKRDLNMGLRLDYWLVSEEYAANVADSYILHDDLKGMSDHCPVGVAFAPPK